MATSSPSSAGAALIARSSFFLSLRSRLKLAWRSNPSLPQPRNATSATVTGFTQRTLAARKGTCDGSCSTAAFTASGASVADSARRLSSSKPVPTRPT
ncbi:hypothetical protein D3C73_830240 [compost metagenome]